VNENALFAELDLVSHVRFLMILHKTLFANAFAVGGRQVAMHRLLSSFYFMSVRFTAHAL